VRLVLFFLVNFGWNWPMSLKVINLWRSRREAKRVFFREKVTKINAHYDFFVLRFQSH